MLNLYLLTPPHSHGLDEAMSFVVRAADPCSARELAAEQCGNEGKETWLNPALSSCQLLTGLPSYSGVICREYNAG